MVKLLLPWYGGKRRELTCGLVDAGPGGVGILMADRLATGTLVNVEARVQLSGSWFRITGQTEVANTRSVGHNEYRVGLRFVDVRWERMEAPGGAGATEEQPGGDASA